jgi:hypothetical protein
MIQINTHLRAPAPFAPSASPAPSCQLKAF